MIDGDTPRKAVMSVGWNPFYKNTKRSAVSCCELQDDRQEIHIMHKFDADFYSANIRMVVTSFLRPEQNFTSLGTVRSVPLLTLLQKLSLQQYTQILQMRRRC